MKSYAASIIMAAGRGSRMKSYDGNKTLLPLVPGSSPYEGEKPILLEILDALPAGPKALIVNYKSEDVKSATKNLNLTYCHQPSLNGTGGALLAAASFIEETRSEYLIITMGDVPFVRPKTYLGLLEKLKEHSMAVLGFMPRDKKQYGVLETKGDIVTKITEWKFWKDYPQTRIDELDICNSGIYAARREELLRFLPVLKSRPQTVTKERGGKMVNIKEYFITDIIEYMNDEGMSVGYVLAENEDETMGVDDPEALEKARKIYKGM